MRVYDDDCFLFEWIRRIMLQDVSNEKKIIILTKKTMKLHDWDWTPGYNKKVKSEGGLTK